MTTRHVRMSAVTVDRNGRRLLDAVSLEAQAGDFVGIVGPNGAGKSTLLRVLAGDQAPNAGSVEVAGVDPMQATVRQLARIRAFVGPQTVSDVAFRVSEVVTMAQRAQNADRDSFAEVAEAALIRVDIAHLAGRELRTLSSGEQQRARIALAIAQQTPVMLLDEPTSALDVGHQELVMKVLRQLGSSGVAVVTVLHDLNLAAVYADRLLLLDKGSVAAFGPAREVLTASRLSAVYQQPMAVIDHPFRDCPLVLSTG